MDTVKTPNVHRGHRQRMRQRYLSTGADSFSDHELLELLLYPFIPYVDVNALAHTLLDDYHGFGGLFRAPREDLAGYKGMTNRAVDAITMYGNLIQAFAASSGRTIASVERISDASLFLASHALTDGSFHVLCLDCKNNVKACVTVADYASALSNLKQLLNKALVHEPIGVIIGHYAEVAEPTEYDTLLTSKLLLALKALGVRLIDHLILSTDNGCYSYNASKLLDSLTTRTDFCEVAELADKATNTTLK